MSHYLAILRFNNFLIRVLRRDVGVVLAAMVLKRVGDSKIQERLFKVIGMKEFDNEIQRLVYDEFGEELDLKDQEIESKNQKIEEITKTNATFKRKIRELKDEIGDSIPPKVEEILNSLLML